MAQPNSNDSPNLDALIAMLGGVEPSSEELPAEEPSAEEDISQKPEESSSLPEPSPAPRQQVSPPAQGDRPAKKQPTVEKTAEQQVMELFASIDSSAKKTSGSRTEDVEDEIDVIQNILIPPEVQAYGRAIAVMEKQIEQIESDLDGKPQELLRQILPVIQKILAAQIAELEEKQKQFVQIEINQLNTFIVNLEQQIVAVNENISDVQESYFEAIVPRIKSEFASVVEARFESFRQQNQALISNMLTEVVSGLARHFSEQIGDLKQNIRTEIVEPEFKAMKAELLGEIRPILEDIMNTTAPEEQNISFVVRGISETEN